MEGTLFTGTVEIAAAQAGGGNDLFLTAIMFLGMFAVVYFLMIRPQKKQRDTHAKLISGLKKGDEVVLSSGIIGKIFAVEDKVIVLDLGRDNRVRVMKQAVSNTTAALLSEKTGGDKKEDDE